MSNFKQQVHQCGLSPKSLTRLLGLDGEERNYHTTRNWITGHRTPDPEAVKKLTELSIEIKRIFEEKRNDTTK